MEARSLGARGAINEARWAGGGLVGLRVTYVHRGAPGDRRTIAGELIVGVHRSFLELEDGGMIPFHRVQRIERGDAVVWKRRS